MAFVMGRTHVSTKWVLKTVNIVVDKTQTIEKRIQVMAIEKDKYRSYEEETKQN